jgi:hypothetical protein
MFGQSCLTRAGGSSKLGLDWLDCVEMSNTYPIPTKMTLSRIVPSDARRPKIWQYVKSEVALNDRASLDASGGEVSCGAVLTREKPKQCTRYLISPLTAYRGIPLNCYIILNIACIWRAAHNDPTLYVMMRDALLIIYGIQSHHR